MSQQNIKQLKVKDLLDEELRLQKAQQAIDDLLMAANQDKTLKGQLEAATSRESLVEIAIKHGYELAVADLETLRRRVQELAQLNSSDKFDEDELSEQELELVAGGHGFTSARTKGPRRPVTPASIDF